MRLLPAAVGLALQAGDEGTQRGGRIADEVHLVGVAHPDEGGVEVDLDPARLAELGHELRVGEARPDGEEGVAVTHHLVAGAAAEQPDRACHVGQLVAQHVLAQQGLGHPGTEQVGDLLDLGARGPRPLSHEDGHLLTGVEDLGRPVDPRRVGGDRRPLLVHARRDHLEGVCRRAVVELLDVVRDDDGRRGPTGAGDPDGPVDDVGQLFGDRHHVDVVARDVLEQADEVDLLLVVAAHRAAVGLADDRDDRDVVELGVVQPVEQMDGSRAGRGHAHAGAAAELRVADRLEGGHLLVPRLDERGRVVGAPEGAQQPVDAVARIGEDLLDAPLAEPFEDVVGDLRHWPVSFAVADLRPVSCRPAVTSVAVRGEAMVGAPGTTSAATWIASCPPLSSHEPGSDRRGRRRAWPSPP